MSLYQINVEYNNRTVVSMENYRGKVLLIVNTATTCFFTPQYKGLQYLYSKLKDHLISLVISFLVEQMVQIWRLMSFV